jgi:hypothetical protein
VRILRRLLPTGSRDGTIDAPASLADPERDPERRLASGNSDTIRVIVEAEAQSAAHRHAAALAAIARALAVDRDDRKLLLARASILFAWGGSFRECIQASRGVRLRQWIAMRHSLIAVAPCHIGG